MSYQNTYNEILQRAIAAHEAGVQLDASLAIPRECTKMLQEIFDANARWIRGVSRLIAIGMIPEKEGHEGEKVLHMIDELIRARAAAIGYRLDLSAAGDPEDPMPESIPEEIHLIDFHAGGDPIYKKAVISGRSIIGKITNNRRLADVPVLLCRCSCGNYFLTTENAVLGGHAAYCGSNCMSRPGKHAKIPKAKTLSDEEKRLRTVWGNMIRRCTSPAENDWKNYGGRGIHVCKEWLESFDAFRDWAQLSGYRQGLTLDRIDNDGDYTPQNCQWSTMKEQSNNRRGCIYVTYGGQQMTLKQAAETSGLPYQALRYRYHAHGEAGLFDPLQHTAARSGR